ncbi:MAG TPA: hypothetical protein PLC17_09770 [Tenuifilaceae bacterium]|nr:hypothetical protein [Tenuifilaceae bacterium]HQB77166.1 hypothetical protein [Tenuifilaceae bacterium]
MKLFARIRQSLALVIAVTLFIAVRFVMAIPEVSLSSKSNIQDSDVDPNVNIIELFSTLSRGMVVGQVSSTEKVQLQVPVFYVIGESRLYSTVAGGLYGLQPKERAVTAVSKYILGRNLRI